ncbi:oligosaccharide flippase family protein [Xanthobacter autotrophicus]|uniref:oligosaccharide flippase family protein n=1 Tax=Xanthobacter autotrophicus TaxID=280 RepID=UPI00372ABC86
MAIWGRLAKSEVTIVAFGQIVQQILTLCTGIIIARSIGSDGYGLVNLQKALFTAALLVAPLGLDLALLRYCGQHPMDAPQTLATITSLRVISLIVNTGMLAFFVLFLGDFLEQSVFRHSEFAYLFIITMIALPMAADLAILGACYRVLERPGMYALMTIYLQSIVRVILVVIVIYFVPTVAAVVYINTIQIVLSAGVVAVHYRRLAASVRRTDGGDAQVPARRPWMSAQAWTNARKILGDSVFMAMNLFVYGVMRFLDILMLGSMAAARDVGEYGAVSTISQLIQVYPLAMSQTLGPRIARLYHAGDIVGLRDALNRYIQLATLVASFIFAGIAAFGTRLDLLFGASFSFHADVAFLVPLGYLLSATLAPTGYALSMTGRHRSELVILVVGAACLIGLGLLLIPSHGQLGAAIAVAVSFGLVNIIRFMFVARYFKFRPGRLLDLVPPVLGLAIAFGARELVALAMERSLVSTIVGCVIYAAVYGTIVWLCLLPPGMRAALAASVMRRGAGQPMDPPD